MCKSLYNASYPKMGNYSKGQVRILQGEEPKARFRPVKKMVPLNMLCKSPGNCNNKGIGIGRTGIDLCLNGRVSTSVMSGMHNCIGHDATCRDLATGGFKSPGCCSDYKRENSNDIVNPLRNDIGIEKTLQLFFKEPEMKGLNPAITKVEDGGWQRIQGVMDSGASESVAHPSMCPQYRVKPSAGSNAGQKYVSASGDVIPNLGEQLLDAETDDGMSTKIRYQSADVSRPLNSVSEICDAGGDDGQYVVFSKNGGVIMNLETGRRTPFSRVDGIYELGLWVKPPPSEEASVFPRPGK